MKAAVIDTLGAAPRVIAHPDPSPSAGNGGWVDLVVDSVWGPWARTSPA